MNTCVGLARRSRGISIGAECGPLAIIFIVAAVVAWFSHVYHEPWRDEIQVLLTAREVPWPGLLEACRVEGATPAIYFLAKALYSFADDLEVLTLVAAISQALLLGATFALVRVLGNGRAAALLVTLAFATTFSFAYELGVIVRQYAAGMGLAFLSMAAFFSAQKMNQSLRHVAGAGVLAGLASATTTHAGCLSLSVALVFGALQGKRGQWGRLLTTAVSAMPGMVLTIYIIAPYANRTPVGNVPFAVSVESAVGSVPRLVMSGLLPQARWSFPMAESSSHVGGFLLCALLVVVIGEGVRAGRLAPELLVLLGGALLSWAPLLYIFIYRYEGHHRHHVFLTIPVIVITAGLLAHDLSVRGTARAFGLLGFALIAPGSWCSGAPQSFISWPMQHTRLFQRNW